MLYNPLHQNLNKKEAPTLHTLTEKGKKIIPLDQQERITEFM